MNLELLNGGGVEDIGGILEIKEDPTRPRWLDFPDLAGFQVSVRLPDIPGIRGLAYQVVDEVRQAGAAAGAALEDPGAVGRKISRFMVTDWRGLTGGHLRELLTGAPGVAVKAKKTQPVPFNPAVADVLVRFSQRFNEFLDRAWREGEARAAAVEDADLKNS